MIGTLLDTLGVVAAIGLLTAFALTGPLVHLHDRSAPTETPDSIAARATDAVRQAHGTPPTATPRPCRRTQTNTVPRPRIPVTESLLVDQVAS